MKTDLKYPHKFQYWILAFFLMLTTNSYSCINCDKKVQQAIYRSFCENLELWYGFGALAAVVIFLTYYASKYNNTIYHNSAYLSGTPLACAAIIIGIGLGGFADGIIFHQILQWHEMISNKILPNTLLNKNVNMFWDGVFHLFTLIITTTGVIVLWRLSKFVNINKSGYFFSGGMLAGWGLFNVLEGIINHHILKLHNVRELSLHINLWNYGFLFFGFVLLLSGCILILKGRAFHSLKSAGSISGTD